jgi:serine/threonine protein kinase/Flp pilus assembly protein TadD
MVEKVGRYKIERELGRGGMGVVYLAQDPMLGRKVAIKTIHFEITDASQREYLQSQLLRDARASAGLSHPNVVNVHDIIESGDTTYLVMEYIAGETLASRMQRAPAPDTAWLLRVLRDIAAALDYTHRKGVVHRDIKPGNIMIDQHARVRIMDFGLARATEQTTVSASGMVAGTIQYMSPEQLRGDALDGRADQFSMAAVAYEMLTGKALFDARTPVTLAQKILSEAPVMAHLRNPSLPESTSPVLAKALDRQPSSRYPTCTAFVEALIATFDGATVQALLRPPEEQPTVALTGMVDVGSEIPRRVPLVTAPVEESSRWRGNAPMLIAAGLIVGVIGVAGVTIFNGRSHGEAPKRSEPVIYGPPPMFSNSPERPAKNLPDFTPPKGSESKAAKARPPEPPRPPDEPSFRDDPGDRRPPWAGRREGGRGEGLRREKFFPPRGGPGPEGLPDVPDFVAKKMRGSQSKLLADGRRELAARNYGIAVGLLSAAISLAPDDADALFSRGAAYLGVGNPRQAETDYLKVLQLRPDYAQAWYQLGLAQEALHRPREALKSYARATSLKPDLADAFFASAMIYDQQQQTRKAIAELDKAIAADPKHERGYQARGELKKKLGDATARDDFQKAKDLAREHRQRPEQANGPR